MTTVIFCAFSNRRDAVELAQEVIRDLAQRGRVGEICLLDEAKEPHFGADTLVVSLGGDGTFLKAARLAHAAGARILAVNLGRLGFLLNVPSNQIVTSIEDALTSTHVSDRLALAVTVRGVEQEVFALNEVVVERAQAGHIVRVKTFVNNEEYLSYAADGVMVATPTGSTGYNFSAGGPVVEPALHVMILTPIAPHFTIDRSIVVDHSATIELVVIDKPALLVADGHTIAALNAGDGVTVRKSSAPVRVVATQSFDVASRLRQSLREGHA
ncbi:MAG TPA: NAD(+)/NADH kinase [Acidimicrobiales bacterium]|jgi:NAD+ kinase